MTAPKQMIMRCAPQASSSSPPLKTILTLPRHPLNQPEVISSRPSQVSQTKSTASVRYHPDTYMSNTSSRADYLSNESSTVDDIREISEVFSLSFRGTRNKNTFAQRVFFVLGLQMSFTFIIFFLIQWQIHIKNQFRQSFIPLFTIFSILLILLIVIMLSCSKWVRESPNSVIILSLTTVSVTVQWSSLSAYCNFTQIIFFMSGSMMITFFTVSVLASQKKFQITGVCMLVIIFAILAISIAITTTCISVFCLQKSELKFVIIAAVFTILDIIFILILLRNMLLDQELNRRDFFFGALILYMSITTPYAFKSLHAWAKRRQTEPSYDEDFASESRSH